RDDGILEGPVLVRVFEGLKDGLGRESVPQGVPPGLPLSGFGLRARAPEGGVAVRLDLAERCHGRLASAGASCPTRACFAALPCGGVSPAGGGEAGDPLGDGGLSAMAGRGGAPFARVASQSPRAIWIGSMRAVFHHSGSLRERWSSRWCSRQRGTVNSSLTFRPNASFWAKRTWCG